MHAPTCKHKQHPHAPCISTLQTSDSTSARSCAGPTHKAAAVVSCLLPVGRQLLSVGATGLRRSVHVCVLATKDPACRVSMWRRARATRCKRERSNRDIASLAPPLPLRCILAVGLLHASLCVKRCRLLQRFEAHSNSCACPVLRQQHDRITHPPNTGCMYETTQWSHNSGCITHGCCQQG
jgi:hypothetical protein